MSLMEDGTSVLPPLDCNFRSNNRCLHLLSTGVIKTWPKAIWGRMGFFFLRLTVVVHHAGRSGQELLAGTEQKPRKKLFTGLLLTPCSATLLIQPRTSQSPERRHQSELGPPTSVLNQVNVPQTCLQANLKEAFSQLEFLLY